MRNRQLSALKTLIKLSEKLLGPKPAFNVTDLIKLLLILGEGGPKGRKSLSRDLRLGEGSVRTILSRLQGHGLLKVERGGCLLTDRGRYIYGELLRILTLPKPIDAGPFNQGKWNYVILARKSAAKIKSGLEQRDAAVRAGAKGATTIIYVGGRFLLPDGKIELEKIYPLPLWDSLRALLKPEDEDSIIIVGADSIRAAEDGALAAALHTILSDSSLYGQKT